MEKALKICKKCGKPIYEEKYYVNANQEDGFYYHKNCLEQVGAEDLGGGEYMRLRSKSYQVNYYTTNDLAEIALELFAKNVGKYLPE